jgi:hypothetical protein
VPTDVFRRARQLPTDRCEHCDRLVYRVWLVPGDVLDSCAACFRAAAGRAPVHELGHSSAPPPAARQAPAAFYVRADGRRPA